MGVAMALGLATATAEMAEAREDMATSLIRAGLRPVVLDQALASFVKHQDTVRNASVFGIIDYAVPAESPRFFLYDVATGRTEVLLVAHGEGSDPQGTGVPSQFSNRIQSHMTSLGAYVTAETYYGRHGLSLRLDGLSSTNSNARDRYIVIHGADYVDSESGEVGMSWGCPAVERTVARTLIPKMKGGAFLYIHGEAASPAELR